MADNLTKITAALFDIKAATDEEPANLSDEDCGFVYESDPDSYGEDEESDEDSEYEEWIDETYYVGDGYDEYNDIKAALDRIDTALSYMDNEDHRYYGNEYTALVDAIEKLTAISKELESAAGDYSTY
jgi:hypothetical protein